MKIELGKPHQYIVTFEPGDCERFIREDFTRNPELWALHFELTRPLTFWERVRKLFR